MNRFFLPSVVAVAFLVVGFAVPVTPAAPAALATADGACVPEHVAGLGPACRRPDGLFEVTLSNGRTLLTHGPDPIPDGPEGDEGVSAAVQRAPACGPTHVQHILYGRQVTSTNRYAQVKPSIQGYVRTMNGQLDLDSRTSGGVSSDYRVLCESGGAVRVDAFAAPQGTVEFGSIVNAALEAGFSDPTHDYSIFWDGSHSAYCGVGNFHEDASPGLNNANNAGGDYAVTYVGCWGGRTPQHENGHNQGAVQRLAPDWDGSSHCLEGIDVMCYPTSDFIRPCTARLFFDCDYDTYYDAAPEPGEWLATHWNIGDPLNRFILHGGVRAPDAPVLGGIAGDAEVSLSWPTPNFNGAFLTALKVYRDGSLHATLAGDATSWVESGVPNGVTHTYAVRATNAKGDGPLSNALPLTPRSGNVAPTACFADDLEWVTVDVDAACAADSDGTLIGYAWAWGDGSPGSSGVTAFHLFDEPGTYDVTLTVMDDNGATSSVTKTLTATVPPDPDPSVPTLVNGVAAQGSLATVGSQALFKIFVPNERPFLRAHLDGPDCLKVQTITVVCNPSLDLYVRHGARPTDSEYTCRSMEIDSDEVCRPLLPEGGWWFVRVKYTVGTGAAPFALTATY